MAFCGVVFYVFSHGERKLGILPLIRAHKKPSLPKSQRRYGKGDTPAIPVHSPRPSQEWSNRTVAVHACSKM